MKSKLKKTLISSLPYVFIALFATKLGQTWRLADGITVSEKLLHIADGFAEAMQSPLPSIHPLDLLVGDIAASIIRLIVYEKSRNIAGMWNTARLDGAKQTISHRTLTLFFGIT